jgi:hypothetical protein
MSTATLVTITVTAEHIDAGWRWTGEKCEECPVALAIRAALPFASQVVVTGLFARVYRNVMNARLRLPAEAARFIAAFDNGNDVEPFKFAVEVPGWVLAA